MLIKRTTALQEEMEKIIRRRISETEKKGAKHKSLRKHVQSVASKAC
jgi:hypothetical protein